MALMFLLLLLLHLAAAFISSILMTCREPSQDDLIREIEARISAAKTALSSASSKENRLSAQVKQLEGDIERTRKELINGGLHDVTHHNSRIQAASDTVALLQGEIASYEALIRESEAELAKGDTDISASDIEDQKAVLVHARAAFHAAQSDLANIQAEISEAQKKARSSTESIGMLERQLHDTKTALENTRVSQINTKRELDSLTATLSTSINRHNAEESVTPTPIPQPQMPTAAPQVQATAPPIPSTRKGASHSSQVSGCTGGFIRMKSP